jgi:hypothetical protein
MTDELPFRVVRSNSHDETFARWHQPANRAGGLPRSGAHVRDELIELRQGARVIAKSK